MKALDVPTALRLARERRGLTQAALGRKVGYSGNMMSAIECGERVMAPDVAARARDLLDDPELYMA
ncbi:MAG: helix-turn-helix domain-containing protein, partial [Alicyclobacillus sp.]|nr:helix-turn-helix domain-containing protein [Alicyclobacillus sp.]